MRKESLNALEELTGFDRRTIKRRLSSLEPDKAGRAHLYQTVEALPLLYARDGSVYDTDKERARLLHHQANIAALDEKIKEKSLIPYDVVVDRWQMILANFRAKALGMPSALASVCADSSRDDVQKQSDGLIRQMLEDLADNVDY
jgi:hypothetical protein